MLNVGFLNFSQLLIFLQTPADWPSEILNTKENKKKKKHRRSASFGHADKKLNVSQTHSFSGKYERAQNNDAGITDAFCLLFRPGPAVIKLFSCSTRLRLKFILLINVKMPTIVGILTFMSRINYLFFGFEPEFSSYFDNFNIYEQLKFHAQLS